MSSCECNIDGNGDLIQLNIYIFTFIDKYIYMHSYFLPVQKWDKRVVVRNCHYSWRENRFHLFFQACHWSIFICFIFLFFITRLQSLAWSHFLGGCDTILMVRPWSLQWRSFLSHCAQDRTSCIYIFVCLCIADLCNSVCVSFIPLGSFNFNKHS